MGNKSRGRHRFDKEPEVEPDPAQEAMDADVDAAFKAFDTGDKKTGLAKLIGAVMKDRDRALAPDMPKGGGMVTIADGVAAGEVTPEDAAAAAERVKGLREPTAYESAVLMALGGRSVTIDRSQIGGRPWVVPINLASGGVYGGTTEPWRVEERRRRNKAARRARKGRLPHRARGHVRHGVRGSVAGSWQ